MTEMTVFHSFPYRSEKGRYITKGNACKFNCECRLPDDGQNDGPLCKEHACAIMEKRRSSGIVTQLERKFTCYDLSYAAVYS